jgi:ectoine hydroxylase-related dioxygenase (phytanoyl-CoA dioxygenase family)
MNAFKLTPTILESRNIASDCNRMGDRIEAYRTREPTHSPRLLLQQPENRIPIQHCVPEIAASELNLEHLRAAIAEHGGLIVRNMFPQASVDTLIKAADRVIDACEDPKAKIHANVYHNPPDNLKTIMPNKDRELANTRSFHRDSGSAMCVEAPSVAETLLQLYEAHGIKQLMTDYLGEPPCLSAKKWVLRRSKLPVTEAGWHQDGAFMGTRLNSLNMWIPLNECGGDTGAPGLDVVPQRLYEIASAQGAQFNWSVSDSMVTDRFSENQSVMVPEFNAGDAFFFDHLYLHRTQYRTDFTKVRYAVETWFFGASCFPKNQIPLSW